MSVYVDPLMNHGWKLRGHHVKNCHMTADTLDELHAMAKRIGMKRAWFQPHRWSPHYDLTASRRALAIQYGAIDLNTRELLMEHFKKLRRLYGQDQQKAVNE